MKEAGAAACVLSLFIQRGPFAPSLCSPLRATHNAVLLLTSAAWIIHWTNPCSVLTHLLFPAHLGHFIHSCRSFTQDFLSLQHHLHPSNIEPQWLEEQGRGFQSLSQSLRCLPCAPHVWSVFTHKKRARDGRGGALKHLVSGLRSSQGRELHCRPAAVEAVTWSQAQALKC